MCLLGVCVGNFLLKKFLKFPNSAMVFFTPNTKHKPLLDCHPIDTIDGGRRCLIVDCDCDCLLAVAASGRGGGGGGT